MEFVLLEELAETGAAAAAVDTEECNVVDFQRARTLFNMSANCVAALKEKKNIEIGFTHFGSHSSYFANDGQKKEILNNLHYLKTFSTDTAANEERWKYENVEEKNGNIYTLDQKFAIHEKVNIFENKAEKGSAEEKRCLPKGGRMGTVVALKQTADVRLLGNSNEIIRNVDLTNAELYRSVNSNWQQMAIVLGEKKGKVIDAVYKIRVHDDEGRRLIITASAFLHKKNGISVVIAGSDRFCRLTIAPSDRVTMLPQGARRFPRGAQTAIRSGGPPVKKAKLGSKTSPKEKKKEAFSVNEEFLEWVDAKPETPLTAETEFTVDEVELIRLEVAFSSLPFIGDLEESLSDMKDVLSGMACTVLGHVSGSPLEADINELMETIDKLGEEHSVESGSEAPIPQLPFQAALVSGIVDQSVMDGIMDSISVLPPGSSVILPAAIPFTVSPAEPVASTSSAETIDLPMKPARDALDAINDLISMASKFNSEMRKHKIASSQISRISGKASAIMRKLSAVIRAQSQKDHSAVVASIHEQSTFIEKEDLHRVHYLVSKACVAEGGERVNVVLNGKYESASPEVYGNLLFNELRSAFVSDLFPAEPLNTELQSKAFENEECTVEVVRLYTTYDIRWLDGSVSSDIPSYKLNRARRVGHFTEKPIFPGLFAARKAPGQNGKANFACTLKEYGLITSVIEEERIMTVRWFQKNEGAPGYTFTAEETFPTFEFVPHTLHRYSIRTVMRFVPEQRRGRPLIDLICEVVANSEDGYQVVKFLDGEEAQLWPGQGELLSASMDSYAALEFLPINLQPAASSSAPTFVDEKDSMEKMKALRLYRHTVCRGECANLLDKATPGKRLDTIDRAVSFIALNLCTFPNTACNFKEIKKSGFNTANDFLSSEMFKDAQKFVSLLYSNYESEELTALKEKYPEWEHQVYDLHSTNEAGISKLAENNVMHMAFPPQNDADNSSGVIHSISATYKQSTVYVMPFPRDAALKQKIDNIVCPKQKTNNSPFGNVRGLNHLSFLIHNPFPGLQFIKPECLVYVNLAAGRMAELLKTELLKDESLASLTVCTQMDAEVMNTIMIAQHTVVTGVAVPEEAETSDARLVDDESWDSVILQIDAMNLQDHYRFGGQRENELAKKIRTMAFDFQKIYDALALSHENLAENPPRLNTKDFKEDSMVSGSALSFEVIPLTYKIDVASDCVSSEISDSFILLHVMSQIITSEHWPTLNIEIHKNLFNDSSLDQNFVKSLICLRQAGILSGPFFDIAEAKEMSMLLTKQYLSGKGEWVTKLGLDVMKEICPMLRKIASMSTVRMWKRLNAAEEFFPLQKLITIIRRIIDGPSEAECEDLKIVPLESAEEYMESIYEEKLRDEIQHWIRSSSTTPPVVAAAKGSFEILDSVGGHYFLKNTVATRGPKYTSILRKEHKLLASELPEGIDVVSYCDRSDLYRAVIIGPKDTPYEGFPFVFDIFLPELYPAFPPKVHFHSFSQRGINPNLYVDGKVCVSLLGTWSGTDNSELWDPVKSNLLQVLMSIYSIILMVSEPYYNEPGYESRRDIPEIQAEAKNYNGTVISGCLEGLSTMLKSSLPDISPTLDRHYATTIPCLLERMRSWIRAENRVEPSFPISIDTGMSTYIKNYVEKITKQLEKRARGEKEEEEVTKIAEDYGEVSVEMETESPTDDAPAVPEEDGKMETSADQCRTMFSEGDPDYECPSFKSFIVMRQD